MLPLVDTTTRAGRWSSARSGRAELQLALAAQPPARHVRRRAAGGHPLPNRIIVPARAVIERDGRPLVFVVKDGRAQWVYIFPGRTNGLDTEVLPDSTTGQIPVAVGDMVLVEGHLTLTHDAPVRVTVPSGAEGSGWRYGRPIGSDPTRALTRTTMSLASAALRRPVTTVAATLAVVLLGAVSLGRLPVSLLPDVTLPVLTIRTLYPGAAATEASRFVAEPIEEAIAATPGLVDLRSVSRNGEVTTTRGSPGAPTWRRRCSRCASGSTTRGRSFPSAPSGRRCSPAIPGERPIAVLGLTGTRGPAVHRAHSPRTCTRGGWSSSPAWRAWRWSATPRTRSGSRSIRTGSARSASRPTT